MKRIFILALSIGGLSPLVNTQAEPTKPRQITKSEAKTIEDKLVESGVITRDQVAQLSSLQQKDLSSFEIVRDNIARNFDQLKEGLDTETQKLLGTYKKLELKYIGLNLDPKAIANASKENKETSIISVPFIAAIQWERDIYSGTDTAGKSAFYAQGAEIIPAGSFRFPAPANGTVVGIGTLTVDGQRNISITFTDYTYSKNYHPGSPLPPPGKRHEGFEAVAVQLGKVDVMDMLNKIGASAVAVYTQQELRAGSFLKSLIK